MKIGEPYTATPEHAAKLRANARKPRRLTLTREFIERFCEAVRAGVRPEIAAPMNGVPSRTYEEWMQKARAGDNRPLLVELRDSVEVALAEWEAGDALLIGKAARQENPGEWQAAAWRLERRLPSIYGKKTQQEITIEAKPFVDITKLSLDEQRQLRALLAKAQPAQEQLPKDGTPAVLELTAGTAA